MAVDVSRRLAAEYPTDDKLLFALTDNLTGG